jgi:hypothetical protein
MTNEQRDKIIHCLGFCHSEGVLDDDEHVEFVAALRKLKQAPLKQAPLKSGEKCPDCGGKWYQWGWTHLHKQDCPRY